MTSKSVSDLLDELDKLADAAGTKPRRLDPEWEAVKEFQAAKASAKPRGRAGMVGLVASGAAHAALAARTAKQVARTTPANLRTAKQIQAVARTLPASAAVGVGAGLGYAQYRARKAGNPRPGINAASAGALAGAAIGAMSASGAGRKAVGQAALRGVSKGAASGAGLYAVHRGASRWEESRLNNRLRRKS